MVSFHTPFFLKTIEFLQIHFNFNKAKAKVIFIEINTVLLLEKIVVIYPFLVCNIFGLKIQLCNFFDKSHVWCRHRQVKCEPVSSNIPLVQFPLASVKFFIKHLWRCHLSTCQPPTCQACIMIKYWVWCKIAFAKYKSSMKQGPVSTMQKTGWTSYSS